nr:hypothetical protein [Bacteroidota bacterium]
MHKKKIFFNLLIRVILITATCYLFTWFIDKLNQEYYFAAAGVGALIILQLLLMVKYINRINRIFSRFIAAISNHDSSQVFTEELEKSPYPELLQNFETINSVIASAKSESAARHQYLENVISEIGIGLLAFNENDQVEICNPATQKILQTKKIQDFNSLNHIYHGLTEEFTKLEPGKSRLVKIIINNEILQLSLSMSVFRIEGKTIRLYAMQNIYNEIENTELESWQKLIRVLTHEIMNSISPVTSLSSAMTHYFLKEGRKEPKEAGQIDDSTIHQTLNGLNTINETSKFLTDFVSKYRSLTALPYPDFRTFEVSALFNRVSTLMEEQVQENPITLTATVKPESLTLLADEIQIEQVLINLVKNAVHSLHDREDAAISVKAFRNANERIVMEVSDNGKGIPPEIISRIFIPFFSTREGGSGIGLSLTRQIMNQHRGNISVRSTPGVETVFTLIF